ncbi:MAG: tetratricopeptide repeat protein [Candidatus Limnocylindrales bacterium]
MARRSSGSRSGVLPVGTLTFLFTDIEGSTKLVQALGPAFKPLLERHQALLRGAFREGGGVEIATEGDSFFVVFASAVAALTAVAAAQRLLSAEPWPPAAGLVRVRMGLHTGEGVRGGDNYVGLDVHRAARIAAAAHGGQVLVSAATGALAASGLPDDLRLVDLGEFRLKDLDRPERLLQLNVRGLADSFPPPRTLDTPTNLPTAVTTFVGREAEIDAVVALFQGARLVTLTGPGGTGKTRLGLRAAEALRTDFHDGVFFVDLAPIRDPSLVPATISTAVGVREDPGRPVIEVLEAHLRDRRLLLVLDNFEQILAGASVVARLLQAAPKIAILVTSREILHLSGEQEFAVAPLRAPDLGALPGVAALSTYDAVALFIQRARAVRSQFELTDENAVAVAGICARLEGLPLAIELAAARVKLFAPDAILARLDRRLATLTSSARDLPARQRTLRGAIDWSFDLLGPAERTLFERLGIFVGGCTIEDAQGVCDPDESLGIEILDGLASLVDKSLLRQSPGEAGEPRFGMLETIREYAIEQLAAGPDRDLVRRAHADYFARLAGGTQREATGMPDKGELDHLEHEHDNLRAALQSATEDGRIDLALTMAAALWRFWQQRAHLAEGRAVLDDLLGRPEGKAPTATRSAALGGLGGVAYWQGDFVAAGRAYAEALEIERALADPRGLAEALFNAGYVAAITADYPRARAEYEESLELYRSMGQSTGVLRVQEALVFLMFHQGDYAGAGTLQADNLRTFRELGEPFRIANALDLLAASQIMTDDLKAARTSLLEAVAIFDGSGDAQGIVRALVLTAILAVAAGEPKAAARICGVVERRKEPLGSVATPVEILRLDDPAAAARAQLGSEAFEHLVAEGRGLSLEAIVAIIGAL